MTQSRHNELLTREELDAILADVAAGRGGEAASARLAEPFRRDRPKRDREASRAPQLRVAVESLCTAWGKELASRHQRRIACRLLSWQEVETRAFFETLLPSDRLARFEAVPSAAHGFVLFARPLAFALLTLAFGGRRVSESAAPDRPYTRIEHRFLLQMAGELLEHLEREWSDWSPVEARLRGLSAPEEVVEAAPGTLLVASLELEGLRSPGRVRLCFPPAPFQRPAAREAAAAPSGAGRLSGAIGSLPVMLRAEVGRAEITLGELGRLQPGDELPLRASAPEGYVVSVEGEPKFRAVRGSVGGRLAVQILERIEGLGGSR